MSGMPSRTGAGLVSRMFKRRSVEKEIDHTWWPGEAAWPVTVLKVTKVPGSQNLFKVLVQTRGVRNGVPTVIKMLANDELDVFQKLVVRNRLAEKEQAGG